MIDGKHIKIALALFVVSSFVSPASLAEEEKSYTITNLKTLVSNSKNCFPLFKDLKRAFKKPITLTFNKINDTDFTASEKNNTISNTSFKIIKEDIGNNTLHRLGIGSFEVGQKK